MHHAPAHAQSTEHAAARSAASRGARASPHPVVLRRKEGQCACGGTCPRCAAGDHEHQPVTNSGAVTPLVVGEPNDEYEREADWMASAVMGAGASATPPSAPPSLRRRLSRSARTADGAPGVAPPIVHDVLRSDGAALDPATRLEMESRFDADFSAVRIHWDARAAESATAVNAVAYTVGRDVVFASGQYAPHSDDGRRLLAHELAHVVQQGGAPTRVADKPRSRARAGRVARTPNVAPRVQRTTLFCTSLLNATEGTRVGGIAAHQAIADEFQRELGQAARPLRGAIPGATFAHYRTPCGDDAVPSTRERSPEIGGPGSVGRPDLVYRHGGKLEIGEIKPAAHTCIPEGEQQVSNYVEQANRDDSEQTDWRRRHGIDDNGVIPMAAGRSTFDHVDVGGTRVSVSWCGSGGVLVYKALRADDTDTITCGLSGEALDRGLDRLLEPAQAGVNQYLNEHLDAVLDRAIARMTIRQSLMVLYRAAKSQLLHAIEAHVGLAGLALARGLSDEQAVDMLARYIEQQFGPKVEAMLRSIAHHVKALLIQRIRDTIQRSLRTLLQEAYAALCAGAAAGAAFLTSQLIEQLLKELRRRTRDLILGAALAVARQIVREMMVALAEAVGEALLIAAAALAVIFALPEIIGALSLGALWEAIGAVVTAAGVALVEAWEGVVTLGGLAAGFAR